MINIPIDHLHHLLTADFPDLLHVKVKSVDPRDNPLSRVRVIPLELGLAIRAQDPNETYFHVEIFAGVSPPHAELWLSIAWNHSLTKLFRNRTQPAGVSESDPLSPLLPTITQFQAELCRVLVSRGLSTHHARAVAEMLIRGDDGQVDEVIELVQISHMFVTRVNDLRERIREMSREDTTTTTNETPNT